ncbi:MAG: putative quinol monooxygenase [Bacillota bacterium]
MMIGLVAVLKIKAGTEEKVVKACIKMAEAVRMHEKECILYEPYMPVDETPKIVFIEKYTGMEAFEEHRRSPHYQEFRLAIEDALEGPPEVTVLKPLG